MAVVGKDCKVALITGATSLRGIGYTIANSLAEKGYAVILHGRREPSEAEPIREQLEREHQVPVHYLRADLAKSSEIESLCEKLKKIYPNGVDVLVNNAGLRHSAEIEDYPTEQWDAILAVGLTAQFHLIRLLLPGMKEKGWGRIINISSVYSRIPETGCVANVAARHGCTGLTKTVAKANHRTGVTCNSICPALTNTDFTLNKIRDYADKNDIPLEESQRYIMDKTNPTGEFVKLEHIAELVLFLCSPAGDQITGADLPLDAGAWTQ
ncbi:D-beta-hydroxybutyrate dehydrogenase-like [Glandiceps talaboti]